MIISGLLVTLLILGMALASSLSCRQINQIDEEFVAELTMQLGI